jgi:hypothetical protein
VPVTVGLFAARSNDIDEWNNGPRRFVGISIRLYPDIYDLWHCKRSDGQRVPCVHLHARTRSHTGTRLVESLADRDWDDVADDAKAKRSGASPADGSVLRSASSRSAAGPRHFHRRTPHPMRWQGLSGGASRSQRQAPLSFRQDSPRQPADPRDECASVAAGVRGVEVVVSGGPSYVLKNGPSKKDGLKSHPARPLRNGSIEHAPRLSVGCRSKNCRSSRESVRARRGIREVSGPTRQAWKL